MFKAILNTIFKQVEAEAFAAGYVAGQAAVDAILKSAQDIAIGAIQEVIVESARKIAKQTNAAYKTVAEDSYNWAVRETIEAAKDAANDVGMQAFKATTMAAFETAYSYMDKSTLKLKRGHKKAIKDAAKTAANPVAEAIAKRVVTVLHGGLPRKRRKAN
jgi:hypothetical protein